MTLYGFTVLLACGGQLCVLLLALSQSQRSALARALALLCLAFIGWTFAAWFYEFSDDYVWHVLDTTISPLVPPLGLHWVLVFVGKRRALSRYVWPLYIGFGLLAASAALSGVADWARSFQLSALWDMAYLVLALAAMSLGCSLLLRHYRMQLVKEERSRAKIMLWGLVLATFFGSMELLAGMGLELPRTGHLATLISALVFSVATLGFGLLEDNGFWAFMLYIMTAIVAIIIGYTITAHAFEARNMFFGFISILSGCLVVLMIARVVYEAAQQRMATQRWVLLGKMSDQLTHDLRNPLAAIKGALQFLQEENQQGRSLDTHMSFVALMVKETERLEQLSHTYRRMAEVKPQKLVTSVGPWLQSVLDAVQLYTPANVTVEVKLHADLGFCAMDAELLRAAFENVFKNAIEAMPQGGKLGVTAESQDDWVVIIVRDEGGGMNARELEQVGEHFYTTKPTGSGLGLAFAKQVLVVHDGELSIQSIPGGGTSVRMCMPRSIERVNNDGC